MTQDGRGVGVEVITGPSMQSLKPLIFINSYSSSTFMAISHFLILYMVENET